MRTLAIIFFSFLFLTGYAQQRELVTVKKTLKLMGSRFEITVVTPNEELGYINIEEAIAEITRIEKMISSWDKESETYLINTNAGIKPVKVSRELYKLIERCKQISELTDGAFDISYSSMDKIWKFDGKMTKMPSPEEIKKSVDKVGYENIILDSKKQTVFLKDKGMKISFGAIGKGYAADKAKEFLVSRQVVGGIIDAAGDLSTWGTDVTGKKWIIGIVNPLAKDKIVSWLPILESSVATSGNYEKFVTFKGKRYSHIIDPRTGYPSSGIRQVSIFAKSAEFCDALATAVFIMGKEAGLFLINQLDGVEVILFDNFNKTHKSDGILFERDP
ncbi:FAD:protein FMN transferase [Maribacter sp. 2308TA10-17]|uniref:FAD:protein FMN transferase n=1 Tax=Maribacter sp. 2308TA10-17 TaxID=3386276 RepID=UPI0039BD1768